MIIAKRKDCYLEIQVEMIILYNVIIECTISLYKCTVHLYKNVTTCFVMCCDRCIYLCVLILFIVPVKLNTSTMQKKSQPFDFM